MQGESERKSSYQIIEASPTYGWRTFDFGCLEAYKRGIVTEDTAVMFASKRDRCVLRDDAALVSLQATEVEGAPAVSRARFDNLVGAFAFAFALHDALDGPHVRSQHLDERKTPPPDSRPQSLAHD